MKNTELLGKLKQTGVFPHIPTRETLDILPDPKVTVQDMYELKDVDCPEDLEELLKR